MAYSDYGGYAFKNRVRVNERSDATITPDGIEGTPGIWPAFAKLAETGDKEKALEFSQLPHCHALLGNGPIYVGLYKSYSVRLFRHTQQLDLVNFLSSKTTRDQDENRIRIVDEDGYLDTGAFQRAQLPCFLKVDGCHIELFWSDDPSIVYAKIVEPNGDLWHGFSGYHVGEGFVEKEEIRDTEKCVQFLKKRWPEAL